MADRTERRRLKMSTPSGHADWFAAHPHRQFRLRPLFPGEAFFVDDDFKAPDGWVVWHIIQRLAPGLRSKHTVCVDPEIAADANSCDALVKALFELLLIQLANG